MAAITKQLSALSSLRSAARFVHTVDTRVPLIMSSTAAKVEGEVRPYYQVKKDEHARDDFEGQPTWGGQRERGHKSLGGRGRPWCSLLQSCFTGLCDSHLYLLDQYKSQVNNGVLKIVVPKKTGA